MNKLNQNNLKNQISLHINNNANEQDIISNKDFDKLIFLSKIKIEDTEKEFFLTQIKQIQDNVLSKIHQINCDNIEPLITVHENNITLAKDNENKRNATNDLFSMCPENVKLEAKSLKHLLVQKVIS
ncbi:MAG: hypothetical protein U1E31_01840 [Rickettsiales bacterium]